MKKIETEDIVLWILIVITLSVIIWKLFGSPSDLAVTIAIALFIIGMISTLTKKVYNIENETAIAFMKMKYDINQRFDKIENLIRRK